jgi:glucosamine-6-phosphate deaminase
LSFRGLIEREFLPLLDQALAPAPDRVVFPNENNVARLAGLIAELGGIDVCYGGIGIHGHVAFNEPEPGVAALGPRRVRLNDITVTINAIRARVGGNLEGFPRTAFTLGMRQVLGARRIRLYCRNGCEFDWANTVLRLALFGEPGDDYPVTHLRGRQYTITTDRETLATPANLI